MVSARTVLGITLVLAISGCDSQTARKAQDQSPPEADASDQAPAETETASASCPDRSENGMALFGDLHVHTSYSFDAAANSTGATPADAYRYARGETIPFFPINEQGEAVGRVKIDRPLDFLAVTDHGEFLGETAICKTETSPSYDTEFCRNYRSDQRRGMVMLGQVITTEAPARISEICGEDGALCREYAKAPWEQIQKAANSANEPCKFTSFVAYEYTGTPGTSNYHRNVIFRNENVPPLPVSYIDAPVDSQLWSKLDAMCLAEDGCDYLTIPHNSNLANGRMAPYARLEDTAEAKQGYARTRLRREPIMEIFQHKGGSECINGLTSILSAPDELCDIESVRPLGGEKTVMAGPPGTPLDQLRPTGMPVRECEDGQVGQTGMLGGGCVDATDFQRSALVVGLKEEQEIGINPIKLGVIASSDTHMANAGNVAEDGWLGSVTGEDTPANRLKPGLLTSGIDGNPGGLAAVWAKENTRDAIFDAMQRREVFGTSGPRIRLRFFAGWSFDDNLCTNHDRIAVAYQSGVPMGGDLKGQADGKPKLFALAVKDPMGRDLNALHLVKGWVDGDGTLRSEVIPIAEDDDGAGDLCTVFTDKTFDPALPTYYYLRAVEPESPRWHTYDCEKIPEAERPKVCSDGSRPQTIREMAWSSPIWYRPE